MQKLLPLSFLTDIARVSNNIEQLQTQFTRVKMCLLVEIQREKVPPEVLATAVKSPPPNSWGEHDKFYSKNRSIFVTPQNCLEVYDAVNEYSNYFNYGLIQQLTNLFGSSDTKSKMKAYISEVEKFRRETSLVLYTKAQHPPQEEVSPNVRSIVTKHSWKNATLETVAQFRRKQARQ